MGVFKRDFISEVADDGAEEQLSAHAAYLLFHTCTDIEEAIRASGIDALNAELASKGLRIVSAPLPALPATTDSVKLPF